jgi:four helix bundle protein
MSVQRFNFKNLNVYREAVDHFGWTVRVTVGARGVPFVIRDQVLSAALSIVANIAEANGRDRRAGEAEQHYRYALGSTYESAAFLDALLAMGVVDPAECRRREDNLDRIAGMISGLVARLHERRGS